MRGSTRIKDLTAAVLAFASVTVLVVAISLSRMPGDTSMAASRVEKNVNRRVDLLDNLMSHPSEKVPSDMVIYRYVQDSLASWNNQFPVFNDDLRIGTMFQSIVDQRRNFVSPLAEIPDSLSFTNLGDKWYLVRCESDGYNKVIGGLEVMDISDNTSFYGVNPNLKLGERFTIKPLSNSGGSEVCVDGRPMFKVHYDSLGGNATTDSGLVWISFVLMFAAGCIFLECRRTTLRFGITVGVLFVLMAAMYVWSTHADTGMKIFSPILYAGGPVLHSLGSVIIINLAILFLVFSLYLVRKDLAMRIRTGWQRWLAVGLGAVLIVGILVYTHLAVKSIIMNSSISLEIYKLEELSVWSVIVYLSFLSLLACIPLLLQMLGLIVKDGTGKEFNALSRGNLVAFSILVSVYMVLVTSLFGFRKEQDRLEVWANRLAVERDIYLESQLRGIEVGIAGDIFIPSLAVLDNAENSIKNIVANNYMAMLSQNYNISVFVVNEDTPGRRVEMINERLRRGEPIADNSHFLYCESPSGQPRYSGVFMYLHEQYGMSRVIIDVQPRSGMQEKGYMSLLGTSAPGRFNLPAKYAFARYRNRSLVTFKGNYAYPTRMDDNLFSLVFDQGVEVQNYEGFTHFLDVVAEDEVVVISRPQTSVFSFVISIVFIWLMAFVMVSLFSIGTRLRHTGERTYFKTRIIWVVMAALILTLVTMSVASAFYVYRRNQVNLDNLMSDKVTSIQNMLQDEMRNFRGRQSYMSPMMTTALETVGNNTNSDITLYSPDGRLWLSTYREIYERLVTGSRINREAFENIVLKGKRYFINKEVIGGISCYNMYAPVLGPDNHIAAIMCSPYTGGETNILEMDALRHLLSIVTLFLLLLMLARFAVSKVLDRMFMPLKEMGSKMDNADIGSLEYITYDRDDEISSLVEAYNRMVTALSESTRQLAQAERDKAWSGMARQVAHEIKNPLTPMKLQLQRIIRLKERGAADWQEKFDEVAKVLLDHINILTDTANEFSTFAKLYTEEHTEFDLDKVLQEEISMFDNKENITFSYIGFEGARVSGPKPQLTRVFVNLINNAVQAVDGREDGQIMVSLRNSVTSDGYFDIVVEDNGSGVAEENVEKLFTPNFTTKNGGSGLGLAISRSILERCGAGISYSRSFHLGGACFTVTYPRLHSSACTDE